MNKGTKVAIIVLNWNGHKDTIECVESLKKTTYPDYEILIVDNGSSDGSEAILRKKFPELKLIQTGKNLGFAGGENIGIREALAKGADYVLLLNNDTTVDPDFAGELVKAASLNPRAGILCSKVYLLSRPGIIWYAGASFHPWLGWGRHRGYGRKDAGQFDRTEETPRACGCSLMATREFCEKAGLLDEKYFCYCEDTDWGMRARKAGFKVLYVPASKVWHKVAQSTGGPATSMSLYYFVRNSLRCVDRNAPLPFPLKQARYFSILLTNLMGLVTMNAPKMLGIKRIYQGFRDYFKGKFGEFKDF
ncbi:MAG: glycosyltransferase family 2 protein [Deltaproteobacteria bacterium]|nr:glycosyltransferase family 2 protein [Deltaproteobacteria bacterium]